MNPGWERAAAIRDWVHEKVRFDYQSARPTKTAMDVFTERVGVCRDFQHLAVTLSRCQNIPARYVTGYVGDIRWPYTGAGDFRAWYEVWLDGRWWTMDARHNDARPGRVLMSTGRDAADVAITTCSAMRFCNISTSRAPEVREDGASSAAAADRAAHERGVAVDCRVRCHSDLPLGVRRRFLFRILACCRLANEPKYHFHRAGVCDSFHRGRAYGETRGDGGYRLLRRFFTDFILFT